MRIFITGATGLIGRRLVVDRLERGDQVVIVSRDAKKAGAMFAAGANPDVQVIEGDPSVPGPWQQAVAGCDAVVHLAGAGIAEKRWNAEYKKLLASSRLDSTYQVVQAIDAAGPGNRPRVLVSGSAVGYYGDTGGNIVDESAPPGRDFFGELCVRWEQQAQRAVAMGTRVVLLRTGIVLDNSGGSLEKMAGLFRVFLGGPIGSGRQYVSWIHWRDLIGLIDLALRQGQIEGPLNGTAPSPVTNKQFSKALGAAMGRPSWLPAPRPLVRLVLGELADYALMSQRVLPRKAEQFRYRYLYPQVDAALRSLFARETASEPLPAQGRAAAMEPAASVAAGPAAGAGAPSRLSAPPAPVRLLAIDVDGTLLRSDLSIAQGVIQACRAAERAGCLVTLATARAPSTMQAIVQSLGVTAPTINFNGAVIWNPQIGKAQFHEALAPDLAGQIIIAARTLEPDIFIGLESLDRWFTDRFDRGLIGEAAQVIEPTHVGPLEGFLSEPLSRLTLMHEPARLERVMEIVRAQFWQTRQVAVFASAPHIAQVTHPMVDKGIALQRIARKMGASREEVMAIGDAPNDLGMMEWAGFSVAMANAWPEVKAIADAMVASNDDHGVARAIQRYVLSRRA